MPELHAGELGDGAIVIPRVGNSLFQDQSDDDLLDFMARTRKCKPMPPGQGTLKPFRLDDDVEDREEALRQRAGAWRSMHTTMNTFSFSSRVLGRRCEQQNRVHHHIFPNPQASGSSILC